MALMALSDRPDYASTPSHSLSRVSSSRVAHDMVSLHPRNHNSAQAVEVRGRNGWNGFESLRPPWTPSHPTRLPARSDYKQVSSLIVVLPRAQPARSGSRDLPASTAETSSVCPPLPCSTGDASSSLSQSHTESRADACLSLFAPRPNLFLVPPITGRRHLSFPPAIHGLRISGAIPLHPIVPSRSMSAHTLSSSPDPSSLFSLMVHIRPQILMGPIYPRYGVWLGASSLFLPSPRPATLSAISGSPRRPNHFSFDRLDTYISQPPHPPPSRLVKIQSRRSCLDSSTPPRSTSQRH